MLNKLAEGLGLVAGTLVVAFDKMSTGDLDEIMLSKPMESAKTPLDSLDSHTDEEGNTTYYLDDYFE